MVARLVDGDRVHEVLAGAHRRSVDTDDHVSCDEAGRVGGTTGQDLREEGAVTRVGNAGPSQACPPASAGGCSPAGGCVSVGGCS